MVFKNSLGSNLCLICRIVLPATLPFIISYYFNNRYQIWACLMNEQHGLSDMIALSYDGELISGE